MDDSSSAHKRFTLVGFNRDTTEPIKDESDGDGEAEKQNQLPQWVSFQGGKKFTNQSGFGSQSDAELRPQTLNLNFVSKVENNWKNLLPR